MIRPGGWVSWIGTHLQDRSISMEWNRMAGALVLTLAAPLTLGCGAERPSSQFTEAPITVQDISGREVRLDRPAQRVLLGEGRQLLALSLIHPDPTELLVGWLGDLKRLDPATYELYRERSPAIDEIPQVGATSEETFSIEKALAVEPDIAILSGGHGPSEASSETVRLLEAAGIPVVFIDFRNEPLTNTIPSIRILGQVLGMEERAEEFIAFYEARMQEIADRLSGQVIERPKVYMEMHAGGDRPCCGSPGKGNLGDYIEFAGGENIGASVLPGPLGTLNLEYIIAEDPVVYIGTGGSTNEVGIRIGTGVEEEIARETLAQVVERPGIRGLTAVERGRAHALWHNFYNSPVNILAVEVLAKWIHPELFEDLDPEATLEELNERFLAVPLRGSYWTTLGD